MLLCQQVLTRINSLITIFKILSTYKYIFLLFVLSLSTHPSFAANDAGSILNQQIDADKFSRRLDSIPEKNVATKSQSVRLPLEKNNQLYVESFIFDGDIKFIDKNKLRSLVQPYEQKDLTFEEILDVVEVIKNLYIDNGFILSNIYVPEQEVSNFKVTIYINEGKLDSNLPVEFNNNLNNFQKKHYQDLLSDFIEEVPNQENLERGILLINDSPSVSATSSIAPGSQIDSSKLIIDFKEKEKYSHDISFDTYGSRYTGSNRATYNFALNNPSGLGDKISYTKIWSNLDFDLNKISYDSPVFKNGLKTSITYTDLDYIIGKELATNPATKGEAKVFDVSASYPVIRSNKENLYLKGLYKYKDLYNEASGSATSDKRLKNLSYEVLYDHQGITLTRYFSKVKVSHTFGDVDLSRVASNLSSDQASTGPKSNGNFQKINIDYEHIQNINETSNISFITSVQKANKNLDSSEKLSLGGINGVRAYPSGEASGDEGFITSIDVSHNFTKLPYGDLTGKLFYDHGEIKQYKNPSGINLTTPNTYSLKGWGVGLSVSENESFNASLNWASSIGSNPGMTSSGNNADGLSDSSRLWFQLTWKV